MNVHLILKNFGRVESADILLDHLVVFVGNNNSGKTMVMQLIYGIRKELENIPASSAGAGKTDSNGQRLIRCGRDWFREAESQMNQYLNENKSGIIETIFGLPIPAEEIKIALEDEKSEYFVSSISECRSRDAGERKTEISIDTRLYENGKNTKSFENRILRRDSSTDAENDVFKIVRNIILSGSASSKSGQLFLPASRSGLQLLYRHYFVGKTEGDLVMPIRDFLQFLQLYVQSKQLDQDREALLEFGEEYLLAGKVVQKGDETYYVEGRGALEVPLPIASSMIHELAPFMKALSATRPIGWLYCDEVENSLHPLLQREMARWLIRMVNAGMRVIVSSHSDTMASRLNNLFMLTYLNKKEPDYGRLSELKLKEADLLRPDLKAGIYEFRNGKSGKTAVEKLKFFSHPLMGYDFQLFGKNLDKLYDEADRITR